jgi:hypothetical protein
VDQRAGLAPAVLRQIVEKALHIGDAGRDDAAD